MSYQEIFTVLITAVLFILKFSLGFNTDLRHLTYFRGRTWLLIRSLLAVLVAVPLIAVALIEYFDLPFAVSATLLLLSASPGAALSAFKAYKARGNYSYGISLQLLLTLISVFSLPFWLAVFDALFGIGVQALPETVAGQLGYAVLLPLVLGMLGRRMLPEWSQRYGRRIVEIANGLFLLLGVLVLAVLYRYLVQSEGVSLLAFFGFLVLSLVTGHLLGGPDPDDRTTLATMASTSNVGIALFVAVRNFDQPSVMAMVIPYVAVMVVVSMGYGAWRKRRAESKVEKKDFSV